MGTAMEPSQAVHAIIIGTQADRYYYHGNGLLFSIPGHDERKRKAAAHCDASRRERPNNETPDPCRGHGP